MSKYCFGIDVGGTSIKCALFLTDGTIEEKWEIPTRTEDQGINILPDIAAGILKKMKEKGIPKEETAGVGIGLPGPIEENGEIACAVNLHWGRKNVEKELEELVGMPVKAGNDANVAALGEMWKGGGKGAKNLIMATLGTGVGGGIIVNEKKLSQGLMEQEEKLGMQLSTQRKREPATAEIKAVWSSMLLQQELPPWQERPWKHLGRTLCFARRILLLQKMCLMHIKNRILWPQTL